MNTEREDIYTRVTNQIVTAIEAGAPKFRMPWHITDAERFCPINAVSKRPYRGINVLLLWAQADAKGYETGNWMTCSGCIPFVWVPTCTSRLFGFRFRFRV
ncbi:MAG: ArdC family protein [Planctomycetota bacterium]|nr:ArdC family protein [Planctomycetota bacterium]